MPVIGAAVARDAQRATPARADPGYVIACDIGSAIRRAAGLSPSMLARVQQRAAATRAELDGNV